MPTSPPRVQRGAAATVEHLPLLMTVLEVANLGRVGKNSIYEAIQEGRLTVVRLSRTIRVPRDAAVAYLGLDTSEPSGAAGR